MKKFLLAVVCWVAVWGACRAQDPAALRQILGASARIDISVEFKPQEIRTVDKDGNAIIISRPIRSNRTASGVIIGRSINESGPKYTYYVLTNRHPFELNTPAGILSVADLVRWEAWLCFYDHEGELGNIIKIQALSQIAPLGVDAAILAFKSQSEFHTVPIYEHVPRDLFGVGAFYVGFPLGGPHVGAGILGTNAHQFKESHTIGFSAGAAVGASGSGVYVLHEGKLRLVGIIAFFVPSSRGQGESSIVGLIRIDAIVAELLLKRLDYVTKRAS